MAPVPVYPAFTQDPNNPYLGAAYKSSWTPTPDSPLIAPPPAADNGLWHNLKAGVMADFPRMAGQAVQAFSPEGSQAAAEGTSWVDQANARAQYAGQPTSVVGQAARAAGSMLPLVGASLAAPLLGAPTMGGVAMGALAGLLFGGSGYTSKKEEALAAGATPEAAQTAGLQEGALQGAGQALGGLVIGKALTGAGSVIAKRFLAKNAGQAILSDFANPGIAGPLMKGAAEAVGVNVPLQASIAAGSAQIDKSVGISDKSSWQAARESFAPTALMTAMLTPFGILGARQARNYKTQTAAQLMTPADMTKLDAAGVDEWKAKRIIAATRIGRQLSMFAPEEANTWRSNVLQAIEQNLPVKLDINFTVAGAKAEAEAAKQAAVQQSAASTTSGQPLRLAAPVSPMEPPHQPTPEEELMQRGKAGTQQAQNEAMWATRNAEEARRDQAMAEAQARGEAPSGTQHGLPGVGAATHVGEAAKAEEPTTIDHSNQASLDLRDDLTRRQDTMETRTAILKREIGVGPNKNVPKDVRDRLTTIEDPEALPQTLWEIWSDKGGNGAKAGYVEKIGDLYKRLTGKDIEDHVGVIQNADKSSEAAAATPAGAESKPAPVQAGGEAARVSEQVGEAQRNGPAREQAGGVAQAGGEVTPQPTGDINALTTRQGERGTEHQGAEGARDTAALAEADRGNRNVAGTERARNGEPVSKEDLAHQEMLQNGIAKLKAKIAASQESLRQINERPVNSKEQYARKQRLEKAIGDDITTLHAAIEEHSKVVGDIEAKRSGGEPTETASNYAVLKEPLPESGLAHPVRLQKYTEAKILAGRASDTDRAIHTDMGGYTGTAKSRLQAERALDALTPEQHDAYMKLAAKYMRVMDTNARARASAKTAEDADRKAAGKALLTKAQVLEGIDAVRKNRANNLISDAQAHKDVEHLKSLPTLDRALLALNEKGAQVQFEKSRSAHDMMQNIADNHPNPAFRALAKVLTKAGVTARMVEDPDRIGAAYHPASNTILVGRGGMNPITLMHETWHAATHGAIGRGLDALGRFEAASVAGPLTFGTAPRNEIQAYQSLAERTPTFSAREKAEMHAVRVVQDTMEKFRTIADLDDPSHVQALKDEHEFVAEVNANPDLAAMLDKRGWLQKMWDAFRDAVGISREHTDTFDRLQQASRELFGVPDRSMSVLEMPYARDERPDTSSPVGVMRMMGNAVTQLGSVGTKLFSHWWTGGNPLEGFHKSALGFLTHNHTEQMFDRLLTTTLRTFPELKPFADAVSDPFKLFRATFMRRRGDNQMLRFGEGEGQPFVDQHHALQQRDRAEKRRVDDVMNNARRVEIHPWAKTFAEAKKLNPNATQAMWDHTVAKSNRVAWDRLTPESQKLVKDSFQYFSREHARYAGMTFMQQLATYKLQDASPGLRAAYDNLPWDKHRVDPTTQIPYSHEVQEQSQMRAVATARAELDKIAGDEKNPSKHPLAKDADAVRTNNAAFMSHFNENHGVPYIPLGRQGVHFIGFTVGGGDAEWRRVRGVLYGDPVVGGEGLGRDMPEAPVGGNRKVFMKFDTRGDYNEALAQLTPLDREKMFHEEGKSTWANGSLEDKGRPMTGATPKYIDDTVARIESNPDLDSTSKQIAKQTIYDSWLSSMRESSPLKAHMSSDNTSGNMSNATHAMVNRMESSALQLSSIRAAIGLAQSQAGMTAARKILNSVNGPADLQKTKERLTDYMDELNNRAAMMQAQTIGYSKVVQQAKSLTAMWDLALSPAYLLMVGYQPWQITVPAIGKTYGMARTGLAMARNTAKSWSILNQALSQGWAKSEGNSTFDRLNRVSDIAINTRTIKMKPGGDLEFHGQQTDLINKIMSNGLVNVGMAQQLFRNSPNEMGTWSKVQRIIQIAPHYIEIANRLAAALTAHEMAMSRGGRDMTHDKAVDYAFQIVRDTDGDHSQMNIARRLGRQGFAGQATPLIVGFGQYDIQMSEFLIRQLHQVFGKGSTSAERVEAAKGLSGIAVMTAAIAGTLGLPFAGVAVGAWNAAKAILQDENEDPPDAEIAWRAHLDTMFGEKGGEIIARGLPRALSFDMSGRSGYQDLLPFTSFLSDRAKMEDRFGHGLMNLAGPSMGIIAGLIEGGVSAWPGHENYPKALNQALPAVLRNAAKAYRLSQHGEEAASGSNTQLPIPVDSWDTFMRGMGFTSSAKSEYTEANYAEKQRQETLQARHKYIMDRMMRAAQNHDDEALGEAITASQRFAASQPEYHNFNLGQAIAQQRQGQAVGALPGQRGVMMHPSQIPFYQRFMHGGTMPTMGGAPQPAAPQQPTM
jgi:hypothetical protein